MSEQLVIAAARAHALVCLADGRTPWPEVNLFASVARRDPAFAAVADEALAAASADAFATLSREAAFDKMAADIAGLVHTASDRQSVLRAAQAALAADGLRRDQEDAAIASLSAAMNIDPRLA